MVARGVVIAGLALAALPLRAQPAPATEPADLVLLGARVYTLEPTRPWAEAIALRGERILSVGTDGAPNGVLRGTAAQLVKNVIPPPVYAQRRAEALRALEEARRYGSWATPPRSFSGPTRARRIRMAGCVL